MLSRLRLIASLVLAFAIVCGAAWLLYLGIQAIWRTLVGVNPQLAVAVVAAATTLIASTATVMLGRYLERKKEIEAHFRAEKIKIYDEFLAELSKYSRAVAKQPMAWFSSSASGSASSCSGVAATSYLPTSSG